MQYKISKKLLKIFVEAFGYCGAMKDVVCVFEDKNWTCDINSYIAFYTNYEEPARLMLISSFIWGNDFEPTRWNIEDAMVSDLYIRFAQAKLECMMYKRALKELKDL